MVGLAEMFTVRCGACTMMGDFDGAAHYMDEAVQIGSLLDAKEQRAYGLAHMANALTSMARFEEGWAKALEAFRAAEEIADWLEGSGGLYLS